MVTTTATRVYRAEYYEDKIDQWIALRESTSFECARACLSTPIVGNPPQRLAAYDKSGVRKIKYHLVEVIE